MKKKEVTQENYDQWYKDAKAITREKLPEFIDSLMNNHKHDYDSIVHAIAAGTIATAYTMNNMPGACGGITGFQAGFLKFFFMRQWDGMEGTISVRQCRDMLYPQHQKKFENTICRETWEDLKTEAAKLLKESPLAVDRVVAHWNSIVNDIVPFGFRVVDDK